MESALRAVLYAHSIERAVIAYRREYVDGLALEDRAFFTVELDRLVYGDRVDIEALRRAYDREESIVATFERLTRA